MSPQSSRAERVIPSSTPVGSHDRCVGRSAFRVAFQQIRRTDRGARKQRCIFVPHTMNRMRTTTPLLIFPALLALPFSSTAQPGTLDPSFGAGGIQVLQPGDFHDVVNDVIALEDTTTLICGVARHDGKNAMFVGHLLQDGSLDAGFGTSAGYTFINNGEEAYAYAMALGLDGGIYLAGLAYPTFAQAVVMLVRLDSHGTPDPAFGTNGVVSTPVGTLDAEAKGMAIQPDGRIVLGGSVVNADNFARDILFMRYNPDGTMDASFSGDGIQIASAYASEDLLNDIGILADGSIVGAGYADIIGDMKTVLARVDANGEFVTAFGGDGVLVPGFGVTQDRAFGLCADGQRFFVTGSFMDTNNNDTYLAEFNDDGTLVNTFGANGVAITDTDTMETGYDIALQADGKPVVSGTSGAPGFGVPRDFLVVRYTTDGTPDASFGTNGVVITSIDVDFDDANALAIQPDGKIVAAGFVAHFTSGGDNDLAIVRYLGDEASGIADGTGPGNAPVIFPNPSRGGSLHVRMPDGASTNVQLVDGTGRVVRSLTAQRAEVLTIDVEDLAPGMYRLRSGAPGNLRSVTVAITR